MYLSGADFSVDNITVTVPPDSTQFEIPQFFTIVDDDIDEPEQSFAIIAELVPDVLNYVSYGRSGSILIRIVDNDRKFVYKLIQLTK